MRDISIEVAAHGSLIETTLPALGYLAEVTSDDEVQHLRLAKARGEYATSIQRIDEVNKLRRMRRDQEAAGASPLKPTRRSN